jgi:uncharacterized protein involved in exopolysaccharide biosynthesis
MHDNLRVADRRSPGIRFTPRDLAAMFFRHQKLFVICFGGMVVTGVLYALLTNSYTAQMKVVVRRGRIDPAVTPTQTAAPLLQSQVVTEEDLNSAVDLFRNQDVLRNVVLTTGIADDHSWMSALIHRSSEENIDAAVQRLAKNLDIQPVRKSQVIAVSYHSRDASAAARVLTALGEAYLARQIQVQRPAGQQAFFETQLQIAHRDLERVQREFEVFARERNVASAPLERDLILQKLSAAEADQFALHASIAEALAKARSLDEKLRQLPQRRVSQIRNTDNAQLQEKLKSKLLELQMRRTELLTKFHPSYRLVQELDQQITQATATLDAERVSPLHDELTAENPDHDWASSERVKTSVELQALQGREAVAREQVSSYRYRAQGLARSAIEQGALEQKLKAAQDKYLLYAGKREEARIGDALDETGILNVAIAQPPRTPALPSRPLWAAVCLSIVLAFPFSAGAVLIADRADQTLRTPSDVFDVLEMPVLASVPAVRSKQPAMWRQL